MKFNLDGLDVYFPYDYLYEEQYNYMLNLKKAIDQKGHALLEMPTGTGKTVCLVSLITSYQLQYPHTGKLIYCTRTVPEMVKCMEEIKRVMEYRVKLLGPQGDKNVLALCLSSRRNMCIHPRINEEGDRETVDTLCRQMTASWVRAKAAKEGNGGGTALCDFYENYERDGTNAEIPRGVYSLEDLKTLGEQKGWCPYFMTRHLLHHATILVYNYQYMLDPKVSNLVSKELEQESIVVFDEAHNIDNVCIEALSVTLDKRILESSIRSVRSLSTKVADMKRTDNARLQREYAELVNGLADQGVLHQPIADRLLANPQLDEHVLQEAVPGNIRKAEHFVGFLQKIVIYLRNYFKDGKELTNVTPLRFLTALFDATSLERKPLRFTYSRLNSLLRTLEISSLDDFNSLTEIANFITLVATYLEGFAVIFEPNGSVIAGVSEPLLQLCCLDSAIAIQPVLKKFQSVIITSGTLSPIDMYPKMLDFVPVIRVSLPMSTFRKCIRPLIVTKGSDQVPLSTRFESRMDEGVIRNYGKLLLEVVMNVPDGVCCFFTSYLYMEHIVSEWHRMNILQQIQEHKLIYLETKDVVETTLALNNFKRACDCGRGAVFLSIARGKVAEGVDFDRHYGRCVVLFGIPYQYTKSPVLKARLDFLGDKHQIHPKDFLTFDALRQSAQCVGRVIRSKTDYGLVILADSRYNKQDKITKFPLWIKDFLAADGSRNLSTHEAISLIKVFLREMGQPIDQASLHSILLTEEMVASRSKQQVAGWVGTRDVVGGGRGKDDLQHHMITMGGEGGDEIEVAMGGDEEEGKGESGGDGLISSRGSLKRKHSHE